MIVASNSLPQDVREAIEWLLFVADQKLKESDRPPWDTVADEHMRKVRAFLALPDEERWRTLGEEKPANKQMVERLCVAVYRPATTGVDPSNIWSSVGGPFAFDSDLWRPLPAAPERRGGE